MFALLAAAMLCASAAWASPLIRAGSAWLYLDDGSNQGTAWRELNFEDDGWASGLAQLGYGDGDEATEVSFGTNANARHITTYFRHKFVVPDAGAFTNLYLRLLRDDGAVVYLNGVEVFRSNMPTGTIHYLTEAVSSLSGSAEDAFVTNTVNPALLVNGENIVAVEIHQEEADSSDISFDFELTDGHDDAPRVRITSPVNNAVLPAPGSVPIIINASDTNGVVTNVQLYAGNLLLGESSSPPFSFVWSNVVSGAHIITARARDNDGLITISSSIKFVVGLGSASNLVLVPASSVWKYLDDGSNQGTAWRQPAFDDSNWVSGPAEFGYGDGDEATLVNYGGVSTNRYVTTYFRRKFVVDDLGAVSALVLRLLQDDGAIVYLNGTEIFRNNMPTGAVTYTTLASSSLSAPAEDAFTRTNLSMAALVAGTNTLAVEIHQASRSSGDLGFNLELLGSDLPGVLRGPWLQSPTTTNIIVKWRTDASVVGRVRYGLSPGNLSSTVTASSAATDHRIELRNLQPATRYYYSIGTTGGALLAGEDYSFTTAPLPGTRQKVRFWALGDCGTANANQFNVRDAFHRCTGANPVDLILMLGDNAYNSGTDSEFQRAVFDTYPTTLRNTPLWSTIGNHETAQSSSPSSSIPYYSIFSLPRDGEAGGEASGTEDYYSFDHANIHFVCLDSMTSSRSATGTMANWLRNDLGGTTQEWIVAFWHHPPYTKGSHDSDDESELIQMRQNLLPILESHGVDLVLCGHSHAYERSHLIDGHYGSSWTLGSEMVLNGGGGRVDGAGAYLKPTNPASNRGAIYVVAGSAGKISGGTLNHPAMFLSLNRLGSLLVEVDGDRLDAWFIRENGTTNDSFTIIKGPAVTVADIAVVEPNTNNVAAAFTVRLTETNAAPVTLSFAAVGESAGLNADFLAASGELTFPPGVSTQTVLVPIVGDLLVEPDETFLLTLSGSPLIARSTARGEIIDTDGPAPQPSFTSVAHAGDTVALAWTTAVGRAYRVEFKDDLSAREWQVLPQIIFGDGSPATFSDVTTNAQRFYRIRVE